MKTVLRPLFTILGLFALFCIPELAHADSHAEGPHVKVSLVSENTAVKVGDAFWVGFAFNVEPHWHIYWQNPGDSGQAPSVKWTLPSGVTAEGIAWPRPTRIDLAPLANYGYEGETLLPIQMKANASVTGNVAITADVRWLVCAEICIPGKAHLDLTLPVSKAVKAGGDAARFAHARKELPQTLPSAWLFTGLGGDHPALRVKGPLDVTKAEFFPREGEKIEQAAEQKLEAEATGFKLSLVRNEQLNDLGNLDGLLVVHTKVGPQSYMVDVPLTGEALAAAQIGQRAQSHVLAPDDASADNRPSAEGAERGDSTARAPIDSEGGGGKDVAVAATGERGDDAGRPQNAEPPSGTGATTPVPDVPVSLLAVLFAAFLGGLVLNLMPCVFPVLSLKVMSFIQASHHDKREVRMHAFAYTLGILVSFWLLTGALLLLRYSGEQLGWGFQLQSPGFVVFVSSLLFGLGLNLLGIFELSGAWMGAGQSLAGRGGLGGAFFTGVLAVIVATPCTAPFMGSAVGFALGQPAPIAFVVFTALALGLAAPYVVLSFIPNLGRLLPRPGNWMVTLREGMAFILFATVIWLAWVLGIESGLSAVTFLLLDFLLLGVAAWVLHRWAGQGLAALVAVLVACAGVGIGITQSRAAVLAPNVAPRMVSQGTQTAPPSASATGELTWEVWTPDTLARYRGAGRPIFVDFTAAWCLSCKVNERLVFGNAGVRQKLRDMNMVLLKADWTNQDPGITQVLSTFGRSGVPLYVIYPKDPSAKPIVLPEVITPGLVMDALAQIHP